MLRGTVNKLTGRCLLQARYTQADWERRRQALASTQVYGASRLRLTACNVRTQCGFRWQITCFDFPRCWFLVSLCLQEMSRETRGCCFFSLFFCCLLCLFSTGFLVCSCVWLCDLFLRGYYFSFLSSRGGFWIDFPPWSGGGGGGWITFRSSFLWFELLVSVFAVGCKCNDFLICLCLCLSLFSCFS